MHQYRSKILDHRNPQLGIPVLEDTMRNPQICKFLTYSLPVTKHALKITEGPRYYFIMCPNGETTDSSIFQFEVLVLFSDFLGKKTALHQAAMAAK